MDGTNQEQVQQCKSYLIDQIPAGNVLKKLKKLLEALPLKSFLYR